MIKLSCSVILILLISCKRERPTFTKNNSDTISVKHKNWQNNFGLTHSIDKDSIWGKPIRFYAENKDCDSTAIKFYLGTYRPTDEPETERLLNLVTTKNDNLRPFYRWILNKTILIQDGALGEYTGIPARKYAEEFPQEFFEYMDFDQSGKKYMDWCQSIAYSGFYDLENSDNSEKVKDNFIRKLNNNCKSCNDDYKIRIVKFADDCFSNKMHLEK